MSQPVVFDLDLEATSRLIHDVEELGGRLRFIVRQIDQGFQPMPLHLGETVRLAQGLGETLTGLCGAEPSLPVLDPASLTHLSLSTKGRAPC